MATVTLLAVTTRLLPLSISQYPFNNDAVIESRIAADILASGSFSYPEGSFYANSHSVITPVYNVLLAFVAAALSTSPFSVAQFVVSGISILTIGSVYLLAYAMTRNQRAALLASIVLSLFGTFVFLSGSAWKESLGVGLLMFLVYAYVNRSDRRMLLLEIMLLALLPLVHHLVTVIAYFTIAYLTAWSVIFGGMRSGIRKRHIFDVAIISVPAICALVYYQSESLGRLSYIDDTWGILSLALCFVGLLAIASFLLSRRNHSKHSFAPIPGLVALSLFVINFATPLFPYSPGFYSGILILGLVSSLILSVAWYGFETIMESRSRYRAIPLGMMLPTITLISFGLLSGVDLASHQIMYRTLDFADLSLALGVAIAVSALDKNKAKQAVTIAVVIAALLISFPFGYATQSLEGIRHDTQEYEVEGITWINSRFGDDCHLSSDERIAYNLQALYDYGKDPYLPSKLYGELQLRVDYLYLYEEEWSVIGVNDYPRGHPILNRTYVESVLSCAQVYYVGGPSMNNMVIFSPSGL